MREKFIIDHFPLSLSFSLIPTLFSALLLIWAIGCYGYRIMTSINDLRGFIACAPGLISLLGATRPSLQITFFFYFSDLLFGMTVSPLGAYRSLEHI